MDMYENMTWSEISEIEDREDVVDSNLYQQTEFPYLFQFAMFFTFYTPLMIRFLYSFGQYVKMYLTK